MLRLPRRRNSLFLARASSEIAVAIRKMRSGSHVAASPIGFGNTVARPRRALLGAGHARKQVVHALFQRRIGVLVERGRLAAGSLSREQGSPKKFHALLSPGSARFSSTRLGVDGRRNARSEERR